MAVSLGNGAPFAALTYALFKLGAVLVPLNPTFTATQVASALAHLHVEVLIIGAVTDLAYRPGKGRSNEGLLREVLGGNLEATTIQTEKVPSLRDIVVVDNRPSHPDVTFDLHRYPCLTPYATILHAHTASSSSPVTPSSPLHPSDVVNIQFTSGTTSLPKAAMLSHTSILNNGRFIAHRMGLTPEDRIVVPPPLFHCFGCVLGYMATATTGAAILFPSPAFDPVATIRMCSAHDATGLYGVSTMLVAVLQALDAELASVGASSGDSRSLSAIQPRSLKKGIVAGSSVPSSLMQKVQSRLGLEDLVICYGMTETSPVSCMTRPTDPFEHRTTSVGTPMPHTTVKIVSPLDRSVILPLGQRGELAASGYLTMKGYFDDPAKTAEVRVEEEEEDGEKKVWVYSGDEACMDEDGFVQITGRIKDLIIRGGENIHPLEVEDCLFQHPGIQEVSVAGVPDERLGEAVAAFIIPRKGWTTLDTGEVPSTTTTTTKKTAGEKPSVLSKDDVRAWVREKLSGHLVPKHVFWVDEYPKTASGKIQKFKLKDLAEKILSEEEKS